MASYIEQLWTEDGFKKASMPSQSKYWMFVLYPGDIDRAGEKLEQALEAGTPCGQGGVNSVVAVRVQEEVCPSNGRHHLQGWVQFAKKARKSVLETLLGYERTLAAIPALDPIGSYNYVHKSDTRPAEYWDFDDGDPQFPAQLMSSGATKQQINKTKARLELIEQMKDIIRTSRSEAESYIKCYELDPVTCKSHFDSLKKYVSAEASLRAEESHRELYSKDSYNPWQKALDSYLETAASSRNVDVILCPYGDVGKSYFINMYKARHPGTTMEISLGRGTDMANQLYEQITPVNEPRVVFVDVARFMVDKANLGVLESLKNGRIHNHKYQTGTYTFREVPHVVIFSNKPLHWEQMSSDRWNIWYLRPDSKRVSDYGKLGMKAELWRDCDYSLIKPEQVDQIPLMVWETEQYYGGKCTHNRLVPALGLKRPSDDVLNRPEPKKMSVGDFLNSVQ